MDSRGHVYGIRARIAASSEFEGVYEIGEDRVRVSLVELDTQLNEVHDWPLSDYSPTGDTDSHGITGFCELNNANIVFVTHSGSLWRVSQVDGRSQLDRLGWMHPEGVAYCASLFSPFGDRFVCGFTNQKNGPYEWSVFDILNRCSVILSLDEESSNILKQAQLLAYGCDTLDDRFRAYVVGWKKRDQRNVPHVLRLRW
jgi:hypothetical protein